MKIRKKYIFLSLLVVLGIWYAFCLPAVLFEKPHSTVLLDRNADLLAARIAKDGQWRFPGRDSLPSKFSTCLIQFEDKNFYSHFGTHWPSMLRAFLQNRKAGKVVSGGSTITMQVIRMSRDNPGRSYWEKIKEIVLASRLELRCSKEDILILHASNAPFGGNVVGLEAASWRYFGRGPFELSWAESATLAVLPNAPSLIHPGKNRQKLLEKRNRLLDKLCDYGKMDSTSCELAKLEQLPEKPLPLPQQAMHLLQYLESKEGEGNIYKSTIDKEIQFQAQAIVNRHLSNLSKNKIENAAAIIRDVESGDVIAYVGNGTENAKIPGKHVDIVQARRSTGSILKPFLFAAMLDEGTLLPSQLIPDVPSRFGNYNPVNFDESYDGAVQAKKALSKSLNVPAVRMLSTHGLQPFHHLLKKMGFEGMERPSEHYGLSLILGGAEASLWEITRAYAGMCQLLNDYTHHNGLYDHAAFLQQNVILSEKEAAMNLSEHAPIDAGALYQTYQALLEVNRPWNESGWENYSSSQKIAWKTGTSFGFRDAWAVGSTPKYVVGVWTGNASGEGRPGHTGVTSSAPLLFDLFDLLPAGRWYAQPFDDMKEVEVCSASGYLPSPNCGELTEQWIPLRGTRGKPCPYHKLVHLAPGEDLRADASCFPSQELRTESWFSLPPIQEWYFRQKNAWYRPMPDWHSLCVEEDADPMQVIYPTPGTSLYVPVDFDGQKSRIVVEAVHHKVDSKIFWHLDGDYLGETQEIHSIEILPDEGEHELVLVDQDGFTHSQTLSVINKAKSEE